MTKTETALAAALVVTAAALAVATLGPSSSRVIIIKDGSVDFFPVNSTLDADPPPQGQGKKYKWSAKAKRVAVGTCSAMPAPSPVSLVTVRVALGTNEVIQLQFQNEGRKLAVSFGDGFSIQWTGAGYVLRRDDGEIQRLRILDVTVSGNTTPFDGDDCLAFTND